MKQDEFQTLSLRLLNNEASPQELQRHELICNTESWALDEFKQLRETHSLLIDTLPQLTGRTEKGNPISTADLDRLVTEVKRQHPLAGMTSADDEIYDSLVSKIKNLPTLPVVLTEIHSALRKEDANVLDVEELMSGDKSLTTTVLRVANSAHFGLPKRVFSLNQAISIMGFEEVQQIVLAASIISSFGKISERFFTLGNFWRHSIGVGLATNHIGKALNPGVDERTLYTCGLLHDIGKVGNLLLDTRGYLEIIQKSVDSGVSLEQIEKEEVFPEHTRMGEAICHRWQLPEHIGKAVRFHHETDLNRRGSLSDEVQIAADCIYLGNQLVRDQQFGNSGNNGPRTLDPDVLQRLGLLEIQLEELRISTQEMLEAAHGLLDILPQEEGAA